MRLQLEKKTEHVIFSNKCAYMCKCICVTKNKEKRCHVFEGEQGEVHGRFWNEGREGKMI